MKMKKMLAAVLSLLMLLALFPTVALAEGETGDAGNDDGVVLSKTAALQDDGTYTITLEAYATGTTTTITEESIAPLDIVLVLDQSGSMAWNDSGESTDTASDRRISKLQASLRTFVNNILNNSIANDNVDHKVAIAGYASDKNMRQSSGITGIGYNGDGTYWVNTGLYINGAFKNYETIETVQTYTPVYSPSKNGTYYILLNGEYQRVYYSYYRENWYYFGSSYDTVYVSPMTSADDPYTDHVQFYSYERTTVATPLSSTDYQNSLASVNVGGVVNSTVSGSIDLLKASGGTCTEYGMLMAQNVFANNPIEKDSDRQRVVILFTDGETDSTESTVYGYADALKETYGATVYCVGFGNSVNEGFLSRISSNYDSDGNDTGKTKYSMKASNQEELENIFQSIFNDIESPSTSVTLDGGSVLKDIIGSDFTLPEGFTTAGNVAVKTVAGSTSDGTNISWTTVDEDPAGVTASLAEDKRTIEVTGFSYVDNYIAQSHDGNKLVVTITGVEATDSAATGSEVYTNGELSGIYADGEQKTPVKEFNRPTVVIGNKTYVLDYAKPADLTELGQSVTHLNADGMQKFTSSDLTGFAKTYGRVSYNGGTLTYTPTTTNWNGYDSFFAFGKTDETNANSWSKVSVLPANNVYYEDDFITGEDGVALGIVYSGEWTVDGTAAGNTETANNPVQGGWVEGDTGLSDDAAYSDGSAHKAVASSGNKATATFTFTGTGVDIYSKTDMTTGTIIATLKNSANNENKVSKTYIVDNKSAYGTYYQIPTVTFSGLDHGEYTVTITVTTGAANDGDRRTYYLDGIRVYNPIKDKETDSTVSGAYGEENLNVTFAEVRSILKDQSNVTGDLANGPVFIDQVADDTGVLSADLGTYVDYGPKHEVYLAKGQSISFNVTGGNFYVGLKAPDGATAAEFTNNGAKVSANIGHASDLFYLVAPDSEGNVVIQNTGSNLLSVTKLRFVGDAGIAAISVENAVQSVSNFRALSVSAYTAVPVSEDELDQPEATEPEDPEVTEPETPAEEGPGDVVIDNPTEPEKPADEVRNEFINWLTDLFNSMRKIIGRR